MVLYHLQINLSSYHILNHKNAIHFFHNLIYKSHFNIIQQTVPSFSKLISPLSYFMS